MIPSLLSYPEILPISDVPELNDRLVYVIKKYPLSGESILFFHDNDQIGVKIGDWNGNSIEINKSKIYKYIEPLFNLVIRAHIQQAQFYFSGEMLVDIRTSLDKMTGPGMVLDLCGKIAETQTIIEIKKHNIKDTYKDVILKCSTFNTIIRQDKLLPLYAVA